MDRDQQTRSGPGFNRRDFLRGSGAVVTASALATASVEEQAVAQEAAKKVAPAGTPQKVTLNINGKEYTVNVEPRVTLMDALRNDLNFTSCKDVCDRTTCGACTVLLDGKPVYSCSKFAVECQGQKIQTTESLKEGSKTDAVVDAFVKHDGMQCGFCTPGFAMAVRGFCNTHPGASLDDCRKGLGGNICRCGTYDGVLKAAYEVAQAAKKGG